MGYVFEYHRMVTGLTEDAVGRLGAKFREAGLKVSLPVAKAGGLEFDVFNDDNGILIRVYSTEALADGFMCTGTTVVLEGTRAGQTVFYRQIQNNPDTEETSIAPIKSQNALEAIVAEQSLISFIRAIPSEQQGEMNVAMQGKAEDVTDEAAAAIVAYLKTSQ
jgi:hypothetical protein